MIYKLYFQQTIISGGNQTYIQPGTHIIGQPISTSTVTRPIQTSIIQGTQLMPGPVTGPSNIISSRVVDVRPQINTGHTINQSIISQPQPQPQQ